MNYISQYLEEGMQIFRLLDQTAVERMLDLLLDVRRQKGRIFFLGVGGGAGHASHAVNDFRKIAGIECYAPTDNARNLPPALTMTAGILRIATGCREAGCATRMRCLSSRSAEGTPSGISARIW